jgi:hypothetical protein
VDIHLQQRIKQVCSRLLAAQTPDEAFRLVLELRSGDLAGIKLSESRSVAEHAYAAVGRHDGTAIVVSTQLAHLFGPLTEETKARIQELSIFQLRDVAERLLAAKSLDEALDVERWPASAVRAWQELFGPQ